MQATTRITAGKLRHLSWVEAHLGVVPIDRQAAREALLHIAKVAALSPLSDSEWQTVRTRLVHCTYGTRPNDLDVRFRELVWSVEAGEDFRTEMALRGLLTAVTGRG